MHMVPQCIATHPKSSPYFMTFTWDDAASNLLSTSVPLQSDKQRLCQRSPAVHTHTQEPLRQNCSTMSETCKIVHERWDIQATVCCTYIPCQTETSIAETRRERKRKASEGVSERRKMKMKRKKKVDTQKTDQKTGAGAEKSTCLGTRGEFLSISRQHLP